MNLILPAVIFMGLLITGCGSFHVSKKENKLQIVGITEVLNEVKIELREYLKTKPPILNIIGCTSKVEKIELVPVNITVTLSAVAIQDKQSEAGLGFKIGLATIGASFSNNYSKTNSQKLIIPLDIVIDKKSKKDNGQKKDDPLALYPLAKAISKFRKELLAVDHEIKPCLKMSTIAGRQIIFNLKFTVVETNVRGGKLVLIPITIGATGTSKNEVYQQLEIQFKLVGTPRKTRGRLKLSKSDKKKLKKIEGALLKQVKPKGVKNKGEK